MTMMRKAVVTENECTITGGWTTCPADAQFIFGGVPKQLDATITCPLNSVDQSEFRRMSQAGLCSCTSRLLDENNVEEDPINCSCYVCPQGTQIGFGYICDRPIFNDCTFFNCDFECNAEETTFILDKGEHDPNDQPEPPSDSTDATVGSHLGAMPLILLWVVFRMLR